MNVRIVFKEFTFTGEEIDLLEDILDNELEIANDDENEEKIKVWVEIEKELNRSYINKSNALTLTGEQLDVLRVAVRECMDFADDDIRESGGEGPDAEMFLGRRNLAQQIAFKID